MVAKKSTTPRKPIKTQLQFDKLKPSDKPYDVKVADTSGLVVRVSKTGIKAVRNCRESGKRSSSTTTNRARPCAGFF